MSHSGDGRVLAELSNCALAWKDSQTLDLKSGLCRQSLGRGGREELTVTGFTACCFAFRLNNRGFLYGDEVGIKFFS